MYGLPNKIVLYLLTVIIVARCYGQSETHSVIDFDDNWDFYKGDFKNVDDVLQSSVNWKAVTLPHDWSIEGPFNEKNPATNLGGALPGGIGWYKKIFTLAKDDTSKIISIAFDGVYRNSEVWINGHYLGHRPYGYSTFIYDITPYVYFNKENFIIVKVDNSQQPNSRWYTGSGINRNVWLIKKNRISFAHFGTFIHTVNEKNNTSIYEEIKISNSSKAFSHAVLISIVYDKGNKEVIRDTTHISIQDSSASLYIKFPISFPRLWSPGSPYLYTLKNELYSSDKLLDEVSGKFGIRSFYFDNKNGFYLNGNPMKILGVCIHEDAGALGSIVNKSFIERQLQLLKEMGCNAIRTAHNPPAPEFLDVCDSMGFLVLDEAFDMWEKKKTKFDYSHDFREWHKNDLQDMIFRDRNHPCIFMWSIGNEIREQFDSTGISLTKELVDIVKKIDTTRPVTSALTENNADKNYIAKANALDVLSFNYKSEDYPLLPLHFPGAKFIATEIAAAYETRGVYDMPSDSIKYMPQNSKEEFAKNGNADFTASSYDNEAPYWGATHENAWNAVKKANSIAGAFVWSGFDYLGEPTPYPFPARSSYFGLIDLAGFPKDAYYFYQSEWLQKPVLHLFPHWNWKAGQVVDVWVYYNKADEVELYLNGKSLGTRKKAGDTLHVSWRVPFVAGTLRAVSRMSGKIILTKEIKTAGNAYQIELSANNKLIDKCGKKLCFIKAEIKDKNGNLVPYADNLVLFSIKGPGKIIATDNGYEADTSSFQSKEHKAWKGLCLAIIQSSGQKGNIEISASSGTMKSNILKIKSD
ncbi:MAG: glycoside hydrolase family 2 TIM barrel-domain containing protein [Arachidicoccus sp.]|nr:glycoside hydrolase family 2 TIM barrel-domain containing protein [Arachidicoccus sp.]